MLEYFILSNPKCLDVCRWFLLTSRIYLYKFVKLKYVCTFWHSFFYHVILNLSFRDCVLSNMRWHLCRVLLQCPSDDLTPCHFKGHSVTTCSSHCIILTFNKMYSHSRNRRQKKKAVIYSTVLLGPVQGL